AVLPATGYTPTATTRFIEGDFAWGQEIFNLYSGPTGNLIVNGSFESPVVNQPAGWDKFEFLSSDPNDWQLDDEYRPETTLKHFESQQGILGGTYWGAQHLELDADQNGPNGTYIEGEKGSVRV